MRLGGALPPTCAVLAQVRQEGAPRVTRQIEHFNLDVIISVEYRVKSLRRKQFRQWATRTLREHLVRGYTLNDAGSPSVACAKPERRWICSRAPCGANRSS